MLFRSWKLGGENSGHLICLNQHTTGDGIISALQVLAALCAENTTLVRAASAVKLYPQVLVNVRVANRIDLKTVPEVAAVMASVEQRLAGQGRLLVRYSGTEPLLRVMLEGKDQGEITRWANEIVAAVEKNIGAAV